MATRVAGSPGDRDPPGGGKWPARAASRAIATVAASQRVAMPGRNPHARSGKRSSTPRTKWAEGPGA